MHVIQTESSRAVIVSLQGFGCLLFGFGFWWRKGTAMWSKFYLELTGTAGNQEVSYVRMTSQSPFSVCLPHVTCSFSLKLWNWPPSRFPYLWLILDGQMRPVTLLLCRFWVEATRGCKVGFMLFPDLAFELPIIHQMNLTSSCKMTSAHSVYIWFNGYVMAFVATS